MKEIFDFIKKECDYEWDSKQEKKIQERINHWIDTYEDGVGHPDRRFITKDIKCDLWRDILTSIFEIHNEMIIKKLNDKFANARKDEINSPSQQSSVDKREIVHTKKISDIGENPISDTKFALNKENGK